MGSICRAQNGYPRHPRYTSPQAGPRCGRLLPPPTRSTRARACADFKALFDDSLAQVRAFELQLRTLANKPLWSKRKESSQTNRLNPKAKDYNAIRNERLLQRLNTKIQLRVPL